MVEFTAPIINVQDPNHPFNKGDGEFKPFGAVIVNPMRCMVYLRNTWMKRASEVQLQLNCKTME
jgi:hypothetical protein